MKATAILLALVAAGTVLLGAASAAGGSDESVQKINLQAVGGPVLYLACNNGSLQLQTCDIPTLWQEANGAPGLQTGRLGQYKHDQALTP